MSRNIMIVSKALCDECEPFSSKIKQVNTSNHVTREHVEQFMKLLEKNTLNNSQPKSVKDLFIMSLQCQLFNDTSKNNIVVEICEIPDDFKLSSKSCYFDQIRQSAYAISRATIGCRHCSKSNYTMLKQKLDNMVIILNGDYVTDGSQ